MSGRRERWAAIARWGFPLVSLATQLANQILVPRLLQLELSEAQYIAYVTVISIAAYIGLADGGLLLSVMREMSELHGAGDRERFVGEAKRARRVFVGTALVGLGIAAVGFVTAYAKVEESWAGASTTSFKGAVALLLLASGVTLGAGSFHTAMLYSTARLLLGQLANMMTSVLPVVALIITATVSRALTPALYAFGITMLLAALLRGVHGLMVYRKEAHGVEPGEPLNPIGKVLVAGVALRASDVLPVAAFPHLLSLLAAPFVPTAIPARTFANGTRLVVQQFLNLLQVHVTRRLAGDAEARARGTREYEATSGFLSAIHLVQLGVAAAVVVPVFRLWLPPRAAEVQAFLPGMLAEQALLSAAMPSSILFAATGRLRMLGLTKGFGVLVGLGLFVVLLPTSKEAAFGIGLAVSAVPYFVLAGMAELRQFSRFPARTRVTWARYGLALVAALSCVFYLRLPLLTPLIVLLCGLLMLPSASFGLWRMFRERPASNGAQS